MQMQNLFNDNLINCPPGKLVLISAFIDTNLSLAAKKAALEAVPESISVSTFPFFTSSTDLFSRSCIQFQFNLRIGV